MNFYRFHIGDYAAATAHLSPLEDIAYRRMLDRYYANERPLPESIDALCRLIRMQSEQERAAVLAVVSEFFTARSGHLHHQRCEKEISGYKELSKKSSTAASLRWKRKNTNADAMPQHTTAHCQPVTNNQYPVPVKEEAIARKRAHQIPDDFRPSEKHKALSEELGVSLDAEFISFGDFHRSKGSTFKDWGLALNTWLRNAKKFAPKNGAVNGSNGTELLAAYSKFRSAIRDGRSTDCQRVNGILKEMGGLTRLGAMTTFELDRKRSDFEQLWKQGQH